MTVSLPIAAALWVAATGVHAAILDLFRERLGIR